MEPLSPVAELGSEPVKRAKIVRRKERKWRGMWAPGARLGAGRNGRSGRALKEKGTGESSPKGLFPAWERGEQQVGAFVPPAGEEHEQAGGGPESGERS